MAKLTLFWMDVIRQRLATFDFKTAKDKELIMEFLKPIILMGKEEEHDLKKGMKESLKEAKVEARNMKKELKKFEYY